jgi:hypothetical protein
LFVSANALLADTESPWPAPDITSTDKTTGSDWALYCW